MGHMKAAAIALAALVCLGGGQVQAACVDEIEATQVEIDGIELRARERERSESQLSRGSLATQGHTAPGSASREFDETLPRERTLNLPRRDLPGGISVGREYAADQEIAEARKALAEARAAAMRGDEAACLEHVAEARRAVSLAD
ncbi:hypothetical protein [Futiania mangrovi]|uniref:Uncharacterized protein n=1 Tax=Futiania mangrovi TaxID=2959716 RepID=A0A9J6PHI7_9PROT|nr:hypothetical protein [Futiania mangrovii]MCP1337280.1 hypothetical protein [Futiania mangrovii]